MANDPVCEALCEWIVHVVTGSAWGGVRGEMVAREMEWGRSVAEYVLEMCFTSPTYWNLRVAERVLGEGGVEDGEAWGVLLGAARGEDEDMDVDNDGEVNAQEKEMAEGEGGKEEKREVIEKSRGPQKRIGLWKRQYIGVIPAGWEDDE